LLSILFAEIVVKSGVLMKYVELGKTGEKVSAIGFGTWKLGN